MWPGLQCQVHAPEWSTGKPKQYEFGCGFLYIQLKSVIFDWNFLILGLDLLI